MVRKTGFYQILGDLSFFIPYPLPPTEPALELNPEILMLYGQAEAALSQLNEMGNKLPDTQRFIKAYVIKEALLSSSIEGIHTTMIEVFTQPLSDQTPTKETQLVLNYIQALKAALDLLQIDNLPLVNRVILRAHEVLMSIGDSNQANPGHWRKQSVRVGNLVPPPANELPKLLSELESYINQQPPTLPPLIMAGLVHVQFETIHPFLDGNGRIGRLLIVLMLIDRKILNSPILYPSYYFKKHHFEYYQRLDQVRTNGDWEGWIIFYLKAIHDSAKDAYIRAKEIEELEVKIKLLITSHDQFTKIRDNTSLVIDFLFTQPIATNKQISLAINRSYNTIQNILNILLELKLVSQNNQKSRNKLYEFAAYLDLLEKEY